MGWIPGSGRSPGRGHGNPLQYSFLENPMDRGTWWATVHRAAQSHMTEVIQHAHTGMAPKVTMHSELQGDWNDSKLQYTEGNHQIAVGQVHFCFVQSNSRINLEKHHEESVIL